MTSNVTIFSILIGQSISAGAIDDANTKTSRAEITLKSATLPRRKPAKTEISLDLQTKVMSFLYMFKRFSSDSFLLSTLKQQMDHPTTNTMRFNTEVSHPVQNIQTAPVRDTQPAFTASVTLQNRSNSVDPLKEYVVPIQKPPSYQRQGSGNYQHTGSALSRQSTNESNDSDTTISQTLNTSASASSTQQPIKKSPREFIIPIAVEGGGIVTPRAGDSIEQSESTATTNSASSFASKRLGRPRKLG